MLNRQEYVLPELREFCIIEGCENRAVAWWPLLPDAPGFCEEHYHRAAEYGADFSGPDDFYRPT